DLSRWALLPPEDSATFLRMREPRPRRARGVPDRTVIRGESRSLTDTPRRRSPGELQVRRPCPQCLQAGGRGIPGPARSYPDEGRVTNCVTIAGHTAGQPRT